MTSFGKAFSAVFLFVAPAYSVSAQPITADLAKICREQAIKAHPTPTAGTKSNGIEKAQRDFFQACVTKGAENKQKN
jgi:hypothetical protein